MENSKKPENTPNAEAGKKLLIKAGLCWAAFIAVCAVMYGVYAGMAQYTILHSPLIQAGNGSALFQSVFAGIFATFVAGFIGVVGSIVLGGFVLFFTFLFTGGMKKSGGDKSDTGSTGSDAGK